MRKSSGMGMLDYEPASFIASPCSPPPFPAPRRRTNRQNPLVTRRALHHHGWYGCSKTMKSFFSPNIDNKGRLVRGLGAVGLFVGAWFGFGVSAWLGLARAASGGFVLFEALRGWCALRACGIRTKL